MATAIATTKNSRRNRKNAEPEFKSKSDWMRSLFSKNNPETGKFYSVAEVAKITGANYAFVYGVASRAGIVKDRANRRSTRAVVINKTDGTVTVQTTSGPVVVHSDGTVTGGHRPVKTAAPKAKASAE